MSVDSKAFVPVSEYENIKQQLEDTAKALLIVSEEKKQLEEALKKVNQFHKASEEPIEVMSVAGDLTVRVDDWRRCREIAMDLLHIPMQTNLDLIIKLESGYLRGIKQK